MSVENEKETSSSKSPDAARRKRPYAAPRLTEYGSVAKLTQGTLTVQNDGPAGNTWKRASCL